MRMVAIRLKWSVDLLFIEGELTTREKLSTREKEVLKKYREFISLCILQVRQAGGYGQVGIILISQDKEKSFTPEARTEFKYMLDLYK